MHIYKSGRPTEFRPFSDKEQKNVPAKSGEYRILDSEKNVKYVGYSCNLKRRMKQHIKTGKLNEKNCIFAFKCADGRASRSSLAEHERKKIKKHTPSLNKRAGGAGRPFKRKKA